MAAGIHALILGFNPCCIGLAIAAFRALLRRGKLTGFQSLLYWISHCGTADFVSLVHGAEVSILVVLD